MEFERIIDSARARLAGVAPERLGELVVPRRILGVARAARIEPVASAWHLGVLLIGVDAVWATGEVLRATEPGRLGFTADSQRERQARAEAAVRGGFAPGEVVHLDATRIDPADLAAGRPSGPVQVVDGQVQVRWSRTAGLRPLAGYLDEQIELLPAASRKLR